MSELPITPFPAAPGFQMFGDDDAGACVDGLCAVPAVDEQEDPGKIEDAEVPH